MVVVPVSIISMLFREKGFVTGILHEYNKLKFKVLQNLLLLIGSSLPLQLMHEFENYCLTIVYDYIHVCIMKETGHEQI